MLVVGRGTGTGNSLLLGGTGLVITNSGLWEHSDPERGARNASLGSNPADGWNHSVMDSNALKKGTAECPRCGTLNVAGSLVCVLCKAALQRRASGSLLRSASAAPSVAPQTGSNSYVVDSHEPSLDLRAGRESLRFLGLGLLLSPVFAFLPYLQFFDWFLTSLFHESGHCFFAWMMGQPAFPAISLTGQVTRAGHYRQIH